MNTRTLNQDRGGTGKGLVALQVAQDVAVGTITLMQTLPPALRSYQDQAIRATGSVVLNLAEGAGRRGRDRARFWQVAFGSAKEAQAAVQVVVRAGQVDQAAGEALLGVLDRLAALTWGLSSSGR